MPLRNPPVRTAASLAVVLSCATAMSAVRAQVTATPTAATPAAPDASTLTASSAPVLPTVPAALTPAALTRAAARPASSHTTPYGFLAAQLPAELRAESTVVGSPSEVAATAHEAGLASYVHRMGSPGDYRSAVYVRDALGRAGWDAKLVEYDVPIATPTVQSLTILGAVPRPVDLYEPAVPGDPWSSDHAAIGIPYSGYSADGDVRGRLVYANYARPEDFDALAAAHVDVRGAILLARVGKGALTAKAYEGAKHGAGAVLIFADPMDGGYFKGDTYPKGPWRPQGGSIRNTMTFTNPPGDPTAIGVPVPGAPHLAFSAVRVPPIPESPVTGFVAETLMRAMDGPVAPSEWHGGFALPLHLGATARARFVLRSHRRFGPIWDVIATMRGTDPSQTVVVGGHRDAWTYGAVDPISGTVDLVQLGEAFGRAAREGWRPRRTVVIGSWDGEELNLFGSESWAEQHERELRAGGVAYVNTDEVAYGPTFGAYATPDLANLVREAAAAVPAPSPAAAGAGATPAAAGAAVPTLDAYWRAQDPKELVDDVGGGSDHEPFVYHEGLPGLGAGYGGPFGTYHSAYDDIASLRLLDPCMHRAAAIAKLTSVLVMRLADAAAPDVELAPVAAAMTARLDAFAKVDASAPRAAEVAELRPSVDAFAARAAELDRAVRDAVARGDEAGAARAASAVRDAESRFYAPDGVAAEPPAAPDAATAAAGAAPAKAPWSRSLLYGVSGYGSVVLPTLEAGLDPATGAAARRTLERALAG